MDFGSFGESNLLSNESSGNGGGAGGALGISANNLLKSLGGRSLIADTDYGKCHDDENQQQTSRDMKIPFELRGGGSNTTTSNHRNNAAAGADYMSPWAVHALLQHQTYSPFRNPSGVHMPLSMIGRDGGMHGGAAVQLGRGGCCFTALQWQELEHQALIFKYILAQEPVPPELIMPIKRSLGASNDFASHHHQPNLGWGAFQMRFANVKADAEPGRCRRTDGKKWRCSRDAAPDQKYCERHMHRGRPRSRKPVEGGQTAINASSNNNNNNNTNATTNPSAGVGGGGASQPLNVGGHGPLSPHGASFSSLSALGRSSSLRPSSITTTPSISVTDSHNNNNNTDQFLNLKSLYGSSAMSMSTGNNNNNNSNNNGVSHFKTPLNMVSSASAASACKDYRYMNWMKGEGEDNHNNQMLVSEKTDNTTSMMIPNNNNSNNWRWSPSTKLNINNPTTTSTTSSILQYTSSPQMRCLMGTHDLSFDSLNQQSHFLSETQQPLRHFIDDWGAASDEHHHHNHQNQNQRSSQLSMTSLPMASTDLGLGLMMNNQEPSHHHSRSYIPVALGGPLAEALQHSGNNHNTTTSKNGKSGALNLLSNEGWDFGSPHQSPRMASPTGVLQKTLASLSDSSSGSSAVVAKHDTLHHNLSNV